MAVKVRSGENGAAEWFYGASDSFASSSARKGRLVELVPLGVWLSVERVAAKQDIDEGGLLDGRAFDIFSFLRSSTMNIWVSPEDKPKDWAFRISKERSSTRESTLRQ